MYPPVGEPTNAEVQRLALRAGHLGAGGQVRAGGGLRATAHPLPTVVRRAVGHLQVADMSRV